MDENRKYSNLKKLDKCPLCTSKKIESRYITADEELHIVDGVFNIFLCKMCKTYFLNPLPKNEMIPAFYAFNENEKKYGALKNVNHSIKFSRVDKSIKKRKKLGKLGKFLYAFLGIDNRILDLFNFKILKKKFKKVLDIGCGSGKFTLELVKYLDIERSNITGIDIYPEIERFGKKINIRMKCVQLDQLNEYQFDLISLSHVLEHMLDPKYIIKEIYKRLSRNGYFFLSVPNSQSLPARIFRKRWICHHVPRHIYVFSKKSIILLTKDLFDLKYYSAGRIFTFMKKYYSSRFAHKIFSSSWFERIMNTILLMLNLGDNMSFIFKKRSKLD